MSVEEWLSMLSLDVYLNDLLREGFTSVEQMTDITWEDLEDIGIHRLGIITGLFSVGIDRKELGRGQMSKCLDVCPGKADFHSKMGICRHELGVLNPPPRHFQPWACLFVAFKSYQFFCCS